MTIMRHNANRRAFYRRQRAMLDTTQAANLLGVDAATFSSHARDSGFPRQNSRGQWDANELLDWKAQQAFRHKFTTGGRHA